MDAKIQKILKSEFQDFKELKGIQEEVIENTINNGSTLAIAPTGSGKSLIYWISARVMSGTCVVISPLISLIDEQAQKLKSRGYNVLSFHSSKTDSEQKKDLFALIDFSNGKFAPDFIFVSPERVATDGLLEYCFKKQKDNIKLFVIDEVHCISQWGFDFRPFYKRIPNFLNEIFGSKWPTILAMTATINPKELEEICNDLRNPKNSVKRDLNKPLRHDISIHVEKFVNEEEKSERLFKLLEEYKDKKVLVYLYRKDGKNGVEDLSNKAQNKGFKADFFDGDLDSRTRQSILDNFKSGKNNVIFATNAFGMGIDIPDIRIVIHYMLPESIEQYYQEIGRGGRDEEGAKAYLLYTNKNIQVRKQYFIDKSFLSEEDIKKEFNKQFQGEKGLKSLMMYGEDDFASIFNYLLDCKSIEFVAKGFSDFGNVSEIKNKHLDSFVNSVRKKSTINIVNRNNLDVKSFFDLVFCSITKGEFILKKSIPKCLFLQVNNDVLSEEQIKEILKQQNLRKTYKHELLDYFTYLLDGFEDSRHFHQEIGNYLGVPKHFLEKIYVTENGMTVRSKSEVIIANILYHSGLEFKYEEPLRYAGKHIEPDFTICYNNKIYYWEHLGLLGKSDYDENWKKKKKIYEELNLLSSLITTEENMYLSQIVLKKVDWIKQQ
ncbi:MAG: ATP-dependent DNA helicase RecQ [Paludibacteraceae bacterium]|nr:ATP-dependent DNA helicase RecQ [Paludibacteraceae bacterium]